MAHVHLDCGRCGRENLIDGESCDCCDLIDIPAEWDCWCCGATNLSPEE
jgi:hypothetical protein